MSPRKRRAAGEPDPRTQPRQAKIGPEKIGANPIETFTTCPGCKTRLVWAFDDRFPSNTDVGSLFEVEPVEGGEAVLWYAVDRHDVPIEERQWFRIIGNEWKGPRWTRHTKCRPLPPLDTLETGVLGGKS
jgi:hypothetical protein